MSLTRRATLLAFAALACAHPLRAAPVRYRLDTDASTVGFHFILNGISQTGSMPVLRAEILIDPDNLAASQVDVTVDVTRARTPFGFATQALVGPDVLDAARFPTIRFVSQSIQLGSAGRISSGARITGQLTIRGQTRTVTLAAGVYRPQGTDPDDLTRLQAQLTGRISRAAFGATGYPGLVRDEVMLDIVALVRAA